MKKMIFAVIASLLLVATSLTIMAEETDDGFKPIFNGKNLDGWDGTSAIWSVEDDCITGVTGTCPENTISYNQFLIWRDGEVDDFVLRYDYKLSKDGNSGMQFRSWEDVENKEQPYRVYGYQADFDGNATYSGILYGENYRGILAQRGQESEIGDDHNPKEVKRFAEDVDLKKLIKIEDWNTYEVIAQGNKITEKINGVVTSICTDNDAKMKRRSGILAIQVHVGPPMKVQLRNILLKRLPLVDKKKIVFIGGPKSHGYGLHTHLASFKLLAGWLNHYTNDTLSTVYSNGWPKDPTAMDNADGVVVFCDGASGHVAIPHISELRKLMESGLGVVMLHYATDMPSGDGGFLLDAIGGFFDPACSVNPIFTAKFTKIPKHPITNGIKPFELEDEWYYNIHFRPDMDGVMPLLTCVPPDETREKPDGPYSNNPTVRDGKGNTEHLAWCVERKDGGRGFGITGGHFHWNWANPNFRKLVLNAIAWTAKANVPEQGIDVPTPSWEELEANQVFEPNLSQEEIRQWQEKIRTWN